MMRAIFYTLFIIALAEGAFAYFLQSQKVIDPMGFLMEGSGYNSAEELNRKKLQQLEKTISKGLIQTRRQMDDNAQEQKKFLDTIKDRQQILNNTGQEARQKAQDQQWIIQQRIAEQEQRMRDQQNR